MAVLPCHSFSSFLDFTDFVLLYTACVWIGMFSFDLIKFFFFFLLLKKKKSMLWKDPVLERFSFWVFHYLSSQGW